MLVVVIEPSPIIVCYGNIYNVVAALVEGVMEINFSDLGEISRQLQIRRGI